MGDLMAERREETGPQDRHQAVQDYVSAGGSWPPSECSRVAELEAALRLIELEVYGRPDPFCRRIAEQVVKALGVPDA